MRIRQQLFLSYPVHRPINRQMAANSNESLPVSDEAKRFAGTEIQTTALETTKVSNMGCWRGYLSGARYRLAYGQADTTATHCLILQ